MTPIYHLAAHLLPYYGWVLTLVGSKSVSSSSLPPKVWMVAVLACWHDTERAFEGAGETVAQRMAACHRYLLQIWMHV